MNKEVIIILDLSESSGGNFRGNCSCRGSISCYCHILLTSNTLQGLRKNLCLWKIKSGRKSLAKKKKKEKKKGSKKKERVPICQKRESTNLSRKERELPLWKRLVLAELHAGVQILNKEVAVKPKFTIHNVKNEVSFSFCKYQPWYNNINTCLESQFWKLYVDSLFCSSAHFAFFPFLPRVFPFAFGNFAHHCVVLHLEKKKKLVCNGFLFPGNLDS